MVQTEKLKLMILTQCVYKKWVSDEIVLLYFQYMIKNDCLHVHYSISKQWQSMRMIKALWKLKQKLKFH